MRDSRGAQIAEYAITLGIAATVFISTLPLVRGTITWVLVNRIGAMLGGSPPDTTPTTNSSQVNVREWGEVSRIRTLIQGWSLGSMDETRPFLLSEARGPYNAGTVGLNRQEVESAINEAFGTDYRLTDLELGSDKWLAKLDENGDGITDAIALLFEDGITLITRDMWEQLQELASSLKGLLTGLALDEAEMMTVREGLTALDKLESLLPKGLSQVSLSNFGNIDFEGLNFQFDTVYKASLQNRIEQLEQALSEGFLPVDIAQTVARLVKNYRGLLEAIAGDEDPEYGRVRITFLYGVIQRDEALLEQFDAGAPRAVQQEVSLRLTLLQDWTLPDNALWTIAQTGEFAGRTLTPQELTLVRNAAAAANFLDNNPNAKEQLVEKKLKIIDQAKSMLRRMIEEEARLISGVLDALAQGGTYQGRALTAAERNTLQEATLAYQYLIDHPSASRVELQTKIDTINEAMELLAGSSASVGGYTKDLLLEDVYQIHLMLPQLKAALSMVEANPTAFSPRAAQGLRQAIARLERLQKEYSALNIPISLMDNTNGTAVTQKVIQQRVSMLTEEQVASLGNLRNESVSTINAGYKASEDVFATYNQLTSQEQEKVTQALIQAAGTSEAISGLSLPETTNTPVRVTSVSLTPQRREEIAASYQFNAEILREGIRLQLIDASYGNAIQAAEYLARHPEMAVEGSSQVKTVVAALRDYNVAVLVKDVVDNAARIESLEGQLAVAKKDSTLASYVPVLEEALAAEKVLTVNYQKAKEASSASEYFASLPEADFRNLLTLREQATPALEEGSQAMGMISFQQEVSAIRQQLQQVSKSKDFQQLSAQLNLALELFPNNPNQARATLSRVNAQLHSLIDSPSTTPPSGGLRAYTHTVGVQLQLNSEETQRLSSKLDQTLVPTTSAQKRAIAAQIWKEYRTGAPPQWFIDWFVNATPSSHGPMTFGEYYRTGGASQLPYYVPQ